MLHILDSEEETTTTEGREDEEIVAWVVGLFVDVFQNDDVLINQFRRLRSLRDNTLFCLNIPELETKLKTDVSHYFFRPKTLYTSSFNLI